MAHETTGSGRSIPENQRIPADVCAPREPCSPMRAVTRDLKVRSTMLLPARTVVLIVDRQRQTAGALSFIVLWCCVQRLNVQRLSPLPDARARRRGRLAAGMAAGKGGRGDVQGCQGSVRRRSVDTEENRGVRWDDEQLNQEAVSLFASSDRRCSRTN